MVDEFNSGSDILDAMFNMRKVKFSKLDEIMRAKKIEIPYGHCNLFINIEPILTKLCKKSVDEYLKTINDKNIRLISNIINLLAHYRLYFSKNGIQSKIFLYYQQPDNHRQQNQNRIPCYRKNYYDRFSPSSNFYLLDAISTSYDLIKLILEYIDGVYMIDPYGMETSLVPLVVSNHYNDTKITNFILSNDVYDFQYVNYGFNIIYAKKDDSDIFTKNDIIPALSSIKNVDFDGIHTKMLPFIISIVGDRFRNIYGVKGIGYTRAIKLIKEAISKGVLTPEMNNIELLIQIIKEDYRGTIRTNYHCIDISSQYAELSPGIIYQLTEQLIDKFDNESLKEINEQYFTWYPIQLIELSSKPRKRNNVQF